MKRARDQHTDTPASPNVSSNTEPDPCDPDTLRPQSSRTQPSDLITEEAQDLHHAVGRETIEDDSDVEILGVASGDDSEVEFLEELGLDRSSLGPLSKALGVDFKVAPVETLSYCLLCKHRRGEVIGKSDILEVWDVLPSKFKFRDKETEGASMIVFGANPRNTKSLSVATRNLPIPSSCSGLLLSSNVLGLSSAVFACASMDFEGHIGTRVT